MVKIIKIVLPLADSNFYLALPPESRESPTVTFNLVMHWPAGIIIIIIDINAISITIITIYRLVCHRHQRARHPLETI